MLHDVMMHDVMMPLLENKMASSHFEDQSEFFSNLSLETYDFRCILLCSIGIHANQHGTSWNYSRATHDFLRGFLQYMYRMGRNAESPTKSAQTTYRLVLQFLGDKQLYHELGVARLASPGAFEEWGKAYGFELVDFGEGGASFIDVHFGSVSY